MDLASVSVVWLWAGCSIVLASLLALDLFVLHRDPHAVTIAEALRSTSFYVVLALGFTGVVYLVYEHGWFGRSLAETSSALGDGSEAAIRYVTAYLLEESLSIDNVFVIALIMERFAVPPAHRHRVLFWGVIGAVAARVTMITGGIWLVSHFTWMFYVFGAFLVFTGVRMLMPEGEHSDPLKSRGYRLLRRILPIAEGDQSGHFTVKIDGKRYLTVLAVALVLIESADVLFAVDSVPAVLGVTTEPFIAITSNIFAILGLRSMYFVLAGMLERFHLLKHALAILLMFIGAKLLLHHWFVIPNWLSLIAVLAILSGGVVLSLVLQTEDE